MLGRTFARLTLQAPIAAALLLAGMVGWIPGALASTCQSWGTQPPNVGTDPVGLEGVAATSACNAWAVGSAFLGGDTDHTMIVHWNGTSWKLQTTPNPGSDNVLNEVAATSTKNAWAVGQFTKDGTNYAALVLHWDGTSWKMQATPKLQTIDGDLQDIAATSAKNAWAVGDVTVNSVRQTLIERWNGTSWKVQTSPNSGSFDNVLIAVSASSATNAWAVGLRRDSSNNAHPLIERWNGTSWKVQKSPAATAILQGVSTVSSTFALAVGERFESQPGQTIIERWDGSAWKVLPSPDVGNDTNFLQAVAATSTTNAWAVGGEGDPSRTLMEHWNGTAWKIQPSPNIGTEPNGLNDIAAISSNSAWGVGHYESGGVTQNLALHCC